MGRREVEVVAYKMEGERRLIEKNKGKRDILKKIARRV